MDHQKTLPNTVEELVNQLDRDFPERSARLEDTDRKIIWQGGQRSVVEYLLQRQRWQEEEQLE